MKYLYKLSQEFNRDYDTYDSMIVCAESKQMALDMHPNLDCPHLMISWHEVKDLELSKFGNSSWNPLMMKLNGWAPKKAIDITRIGTAKEELPIGIVLASFNAG
jgi:hypothetical protein